MWDLRRCADASVLGEISASVPAWVCVMWDLCQCASLSVCDVRSLAVCQLEYVVRDRNDRPEVTWAVCTICLCCCMCVGGGCRNHTVGVRTVVFTKYGRETSCEARTLNKTPLHKVLCPLRYDYHYCDVIIIMISSVWRKVCFIATMGPSSTYASQLWWSSEYQLYLLVISLPVVRSDQLNLTDCALVIISLQQLSKQHIDL